MSTKRKRDRRKRKAKERPVSPDPLKRGRKGSFSETDFEERMMITYNRLIEALAVINAYEVKYSLCFTGSLLLRAFQPAGEYRDQCVRYLRWRFQERGRITDDCDIIFEQDPSAELQRDIRHHNRRENSLAIDWWPSNEYKRKWSKVKRRSLRSETILGYPCQPIPVLYKAKKELLSADMKHKNDVPHLPGHN